MNWPISDHCNLYIWLLVASVSMIGMVSTPSIAAPIENSRCPTTEQLKHYTGIFPVKARGEVRMVNGKGPSDFAPDEKGQWDFDNTIASVRLMRPEQGVSFWLMDIRSNHLHGSGAWDALHFVSCKKGHLRVIPQDSFLYGAKVHVLSDREFTTRSGYWIKTDAQCCPSRIEFRRYRWNVAHRMFVVTQRNIKAQ